MIPNMPNVLNLLKPYFSIQNNNSSRKCLVKDKSLVNKLSLTVTESDSLTLEQPLEYDVRMHNINNKNKQRNNMNLKRSINQIQKHTEIDTKPEDKLIKNKENKKIHINHSTSTKRIVNEINEPRLTSQISQYERIRNELKKCVKQTEFKKENKTELQPCITQRKSKNFNPNKTKYSVKRCGNVYSYAANTNEGIVM